MWCGVVWCGGVGVACSSFYSCIQIEASIQRHSFPPFKAHSAHIFPAKCGLMRHKAGMLSATPTLAALSVPARRPGSGRVPARRHQKRKRGGVRLIRESGCATCSGRGLRRAPKLYSRNGSGGTAENCTRRESPVGYFRRHS